MEGFGTVVIKPEPVDNGDCELTLQNGAYAPRFPVNLVSYTNKKNGSIIICVYAGIFRD
jgi:hypothetical protein